MKSSFKCFDFGILIHSWFSWASAMSTIDKITNSSDSVLCIFSRNFTFSTKKPNISVYRFEPFETFILSRNSVDPISTISFNDILTFEVDELLLPHILYSPFYQLALSPNCKKVSFYQESIQPPDGTLNRREAELLLDPSSTRSLFTCNDKHLMNKITSNYYHLNEHRLPLHLHPIQVGECLHSINQWIPDSYDDTIRFDYALLAGKAMNCQAGILLVQHINSLLTKLFPKASILLKASPSSSSAIIEVMKNLSMQTPYITFMDGFSSLEIGIIRGSCRYLISEMFSLAALSQLSPSSNIISLDKTIIKDFPRLRDSLTERYHNKDYRKLTHSFDSLSEHILSKFTS